MVLRRVTFVLALCLIPALLLSAQEVSQKKDLALFQLGHSAWNLSQEVLAGVDEQIKSVFINMRRFNVIGMEHRLEAGDVSAFVEQIKALKEENVEIPEEVQMGQEFFTAADLNRLVGSFIVVIPSVTNFITKQEKDGTYKISLQTTFSFVNVEQGKSFAHAAVETSGSDDNLQTAIKDAMDAIPLQLTYQVRSIPEFQLKTGIVEVNGRKVVLVLGQDMGLKRGDEYAIVSSRIVSSGKNLSTEKGLVYIEEVGDEASIGRLIYAEGGAHPGEELREIPRLGFESTPYLHLVSNASEEGMVALAGVRTSPIRGFGNFRPIVTLEVPFIFSITGGLPFNVAVGGEYAMYLGRLQVTPSVSGGLGMFYLWYLEDTSLSDKKFFLSHFGGTGNLSLAYMVNRNVRLSLDGGFLYWFSMDPTQVVADGGLLYKPYGGLFFGAGASIRF